MCILVIVLGSMLGRARSAETQTGRLRCMAPAVPHGATHCACRPVRGKKMKCAGSHCSLARIPASVSTAPPSPATDGMPTGTGVVPQGAPRPPRNAVNGFNPRKCPDCRCVEFAAAVQVAAARFRAAAEVAHLHGAESDSLSTGVATAAAPPATLDSATKVAAATVTAPPPTAKASSRRQRPSPDLQVVAQNKNEAFYDENYFRNHQSPITIFNSVEKRDIIVPAFGGMDPRSQHRCIVKPRVSAWYGPLCESIATAAGCVQLEPTCRWHAARRTQALTRPSALLETEHGPDLFRQQFDATLADLRKRNPGALARSVSSTHCCGVIRAGMVQNQVEGSPHVRWVPNVTATGGVPVHHWVDAMVKNLLRLGRKYNLTYPEVTIGRSCSDYEPLANSGTNWPCWGLSARGGLYSFGEGHFTAPGGHWSYPDPTAAGSTVAWESRRPTPVWRGSIWFDYEKNYSSLAELEAHGLGQHFNMGSDQIRPMIVHFSVDHPELLNARISGNTFSKDSLLYRHNATNGLSRLLPHDHIPQLQYLSSHQVVLVLGGIGAAFRLTAHLDWGSCVVLQDSELELWYTKYLVPGTHYVPLARDGANISAVLHWVHDHPDEVRRIARAGKFFFDTYLAEKPLALTIQYWLVRMAELAAEVSGMSRGSLPPDTHPPVPGIVPV